MTRRIESAKLARITQKRRFAISSWVNDQFEGASPKSIPGPPENIRRCPHWKSDPKSGVTGEVYLRGVEVFYSAEIKPGTTGWWNMGRLPKKL